MSEDLTAIVSDVHANLEAFRAVLKDIREKDIQNIISTGDLVGYGPNPVECIMLAHKAGVRCTNGNHEVALFKKNTRFNPKAQRALDYTRKAVKKYAQEKAVKWYFASITDEIREDVVTFIHGSPRGSIEEYMIKSADLFGLTPKAKDGLKENFELIDEVGFVGHTHIPCICTTDFYLVHPAWNNYEAYPILWGTKTLVNVGSVGQPRDEDWRACYATFDGHNISHVRVEYDMDKTVEKIHKNPFLDDYLGDRLRNGF
ncbi:MAG: metallophosphoesterase family protein [Planctomycetota bacterium]